MRYGRVFLGLVLLVLGGVLLADAADWVDAGTIIARWWPTALLALGVLQLLDRPRPVVAPAILIGLGLLLLGSTTGVLDASAWQLVGPVIVVVVGLLVLFGGRPAAAGARLTAVGIFSGRKVTSSSPRFRGGTVVALFGGAQVDLTGAEVADRAVIDAFVAFGGSEISVPESWKVVVSGLPLFGGWSNKARHPERGDAAPQLVVNAVTMFGGLEVVPKQGVRQEVTS